MRKVSFFRPVLFGIVLTLQVSIVSPCVSYAQTPTEYVLDQVEKTAEWSSAALDLQTLMGSMLESEELMVLIDIAFDDSVSSDDPKLRAAYQKWKTSAAAQVEELSEASRKFPLPPDIDSLENKKGFNAQYLAVKSLGEKATVLVSKLDGVIKQILEGNEDGLAELQLLMIDAGKDLIQAENTLIYSGLIGLDNDHPNYFLNLILLEGNQFTLAELDIFASSITRGGTLADRADQLLIMNSTIDSRPGYISKGRDAATAQFESLNTFFNNVSQSSEKESTKTLLSVAKDFSQSFDVEEKILNLEKQVYALYAADEDFFDLSENVDKIDVEIYVLLERRAALLENRSKLLANAR